MSREWIFLIHQIPPKPLYLRAKVRQRLTRVGAIALKNSVYVLPRSAETLEDFQWIAEEVTSGGGQAWICGGHVLGGIDDNALVASFRAAREEDYSPIRTELSGLARRLAGVKSPARPTEVQFTLNRVRDRWNEVHAIDFFDSPAGKEISDMIQRIERKVERTTVRRKRVPKAVRGKTWVTRAGMKIDRIASSWLVRRHIDPDARFRFVDATRWERKDDEIAFDIVGGDYSHEADRCTFETLVAKFDIRDRAVAEIAEIVHDVDVKDGKFGRSDAQGVQLVIQGLISNHLSDEERIERGLALFDDLARSFSRSKPGATKARAPQRSSKRARSKR